MPVRRCGEFLFVLFLAVVGCDNPVQVHPSITGKVALYDELGNRIPSAAGVQVTAVSFSSGTTYETFTDASGRFELRQPDEGPLPLRFVHDGFGDMFRYDVGDGAVPLEVDMFARSSADVTAVNAVAEECGSVTCLTLTLHVEGFFRSGATRRILRVYLSTQPDLTDWQYQVTAYLVVPHDLFGLQQSGSDTTFELDGLHGLLEPFGTGATVHVLVYGATENLASSYTSPEEGLEIYTDLSNGFAATSFIMP